MLKQLSTPTTILTLLRLVVYLVWGVALLTITVQLLYLLRSQMGTVRAVGIQPAPQGTPPCLSLHTSVTAAY